MSRNNGSFISHLSLPFHNLFLISNIQLVSYCSHLVLFATCFRYLFTFWHNILRKKTSKFSGQFWILSWPILVSTAFNCSICWFMLPPNWDPFRFTTHSAASIHNTSYILFCLLRINLGFRCWSLSLTVLFPPLKSCPTNKVLTHVTTIHTAWVRIAMPTWLTIFIFPLSLFLFYSYYYF